jgi:hypothetical protein
MYSPEPGTFLRALRLVFYGLLTKVYMKFVWETHYSNASQRYLCCLKFFINETVTLLGSYSLERKVTLRNEM